MLKGTVRLIFKINYRVSFILDNVSPDGVSLDGKGRVPSVVKALRTDYEEPVSDSCNPRKPSFPWRFSSLIKSKIRTPSVRVFCLKKREVVKRRIRV